MLVLGMHRSGTSALAGVIRALGVAAPKTLIGPLDENPRGFFESAPLVHALDELLAAAGSRWDDWRQLDPQWFRSQAAELHRQKIKALIIEEFGDESLIFVKDPRICRFVSFISSILAELGFDAVAVLPIRNPLEVAYSLKRRDKFALSKSLLLWLRHVLDAEFHSRQMPRSFLLYEEYLNDWRYHVDGAAAEAGIVWPDRSDCSDVKIDQFLTRELHRERVSFEEFNVHPEITRWVREAYSILTDIAASGETEQLLEQLDVVRTEFDEGCHVFGAAVEAEAKAKESLRFANERLAGELARKAADTHTLQNEIARQSGKIGTLRQETATLAAAVAEARSENAKLGAALAEARAENAKLDAALSATRDENARLGETLAELRRESAERQAALDGQAAELAAVRKRAAEAEAAAVARQRELHAIQHSASWRITRPLRWIRSIIDGLKRRVVRLVRRLGRAVVLRLGSRRLREWVVTRENAKLILAAGLFDRDWYLEQNRDVRTTGANPLVHYLRHGAAEGRNPNPLFDSEWYLAQNPDVRAAGVNPLLHYLRYGATEGRDPDPLFDSAWYLQQNPDVRAAGVNPLVHYLRYGSAEGRAARPSAGDKTSYQHWIEAYDTLSADDIAEMQRRLQSFAKRPLISVVMPVYNTELRWLRAAIESVGAQIYPDWELCISDDASTRPEVRDELLKYVSKDDRIRVFFRESNGGISANSNTALSLATGDFIALLDADDELSEHALFWVVDEILRHPGADLIYSDQDKLDEHGRRIDPYFKPDWNLALILSQNMFSHLGVFRRSLVNRAGGFRLGFEGSQDHDLVLRCAELTAPEKIRHIPRVLYHWREVPGSTAPPEGIKAKPYAWEAGARAIEEHLQRCGAPGIVKRAQDLFYQVEYQLTQATPKVSIVIPSAFSHDVVPRCIEGLLKRTKYSNFEILLAVSESTAIAKQEYLDSIRSDGRVRVLTYKDQPFNYSTTNNWAIRQASGSILCLLNDDVEVITPDWLDKLVARIQLPGVGAAGALLYYPNGTIQHAGVILGLGGVAGHPYVNLPKESRSYFGRGALEQDLSCVTAACMVLRREAFESVSGFNEELAIAFNDVDLCIRLRKSGWRILWTPAVELCHHESVSVGHHNSPERIDHFKREVNWMRERWGSILDNDPFYNPNLSLTSCNIDLAFPPRVAKTPDMKAAARSTNARSVGAAPSRA